MDFGISDTTILLAKNWQKRKGSRRCISETLVNIGGAYRSRTDDLLTAREITSITYPMKINYITKMQDHKK